MLLHDELMVNNNGYSNDNYGNSINLYLSYIIFVLLEMFVLYFLLYQSNTKKLYMKTKQYNFEIKKKINYKKGGPSYFVNHVKCVKKM